MLSRYREEMRMGTFMSHNHRRSMTSDAIPKNTFRNVAKQSTQAEAPIGLIPAAGMARRLNIDTPKELVVVNNKAVIEYGIDQLAATGIEQIVIVIRRDKEAIKAHVEEKYPHLSIQFIYQSGTIGNLIHAIQAAYPAIHNRTVYFCMADVVMSPNPFCIQPCDELSILCQAVAGDQWRHLGVVEPAHHRIVDKPSHYIGNICWGALIWRPTFTEKVMQATDLTSAMNSSQWSYFVTIEHYVDIGIDQNRIQPLNRDRVDAEGIFAERHVTEEVERYEFIG